jgi:uncharacterized protein YcfJ
LDSTDGDFVSAASAIGTVLGMHIGMKLAEGPPDTLLIDIPAIVACAIAGGITGSVVGTSFAEQERKRLEEAKFELSR